MPQQGDAERRTRTELALKGADDSGVARAAVSLARLIDGAAARGDEDVAVAREALDGLVASACSWGRPHPPRDDLQRARARRRGYVR
ncbi:hypothetical protein [uncultured Pseudokineococcus sp.]|uniref:hypothetical protein n=1 Tax=uncultured Pseudokineococcus sp. TaxID=1642928 RepID=UPI0026399DC6|nr:hypothetical protein [uncultured Pseudokineococcus sp.]